MVAAARRTNLPVGTVLQVRHHFDLLKLRSLKHSVVFGSLKGGPSEAGVVVQHPLELRSLL